MFKQADILLLNWHPEIRGGDRRPFSLVVLLWSVVVHRIQPLTILKDWRVLVASCRCCRIFNTLLLNVFFSLAVGMRFRAICAYRQKGYSWSYRQWVLRNMNKTKIRVCLWFCSSIWGKNSLTPLTLSPFHALHTGKWVEGQDLFCTTAQHSLWIIAGFVRFPNLSSQTTMTWQLKVGSKCTHQTPLTPPERCQFKF